MELVALTGSRIPIHRPARSVFFQWPFLALFIVTFSSSASVYEFYFYPRYLRGQGMRETAIGIAMGAFYIGSLVGMPLAAEAIRRHGSRFVIAAGVIGIAVASLLLSTTTSLSLVVPFRFVHGVLWSFVLIPGSTLATQLVPSDRMNQSIALHGSCFLIGQALGPWLAALLFDTTESYAGLFWSAALVACLGLGFLMPLGETPQSGAQHVRGKLSLKRVAGPLLSTVLLTAGFGAATSFVADYAGVLGMGLAATGFFSGQLMLGLAVRFAGGRLLDQAPRTLVAILGVSSMVCGLVILWRLETPWQLWVAGALIGASTAMYFSPLQSLIIRRSNDRITAVTMFRAAVTLSVALSSFLGGAIAGRMGYPSMYLCMAILGTIGGAIFVINQRDDERLDPKRSR